MIRGMLVLVAVLLAACASDPAKRQEVARTESARMRAPQVPLDQFSRFELAPIGMSAGVSKDARKVAVAEEVGRKLEARLAPLIAQWNASAPSGSEKRTLVIQPSIASMHVVSASARFWIGAFSGDSTIDMDLELVEQETGAVVADERVYRSANAM